MSKRSHQVAALPWRRIEGGVEILLVTTRGSKRWVIPKGWTMDGKADHEAAAIEAYEEAGAMGVADASPIATYRYRKILKKGNSRVVSVQVFSMHVKDLLDDWPERHQRERLWVSPSRALALIGETGMVPVLAQFTGLRLGLLTRLKLWWHTILL